MKKPWIIIGVVVVVIGGAWWYFASTNSPQNSAANSPQENNSNTNTQGNDGIVMGDEAEQDGKEDDVQKVEIEASNFEFSISEIRVKKGQRVRIVLKNTEGFHDFVIDEFNAATAQIQEGEEDSIEFMADKEGEFFFYCSVGQHRELGMEGKLIVE